jgi:hypothetical protein
MVWLSGSSGSFAKAEETLRRIGRLVVSDSSVWRRVERWGQQFQGLEAAAINQGSQPIGNEEIQQKASRPAGRMGVAMDGATVYIRSEGWKELKVGCAFDVAVKPTKDKATGRWLDKPHAVNNRYVAHLGGPERFGQMVWATARQQGWFAAPKTVVLGDGAVWIWNLAGHHFVGSRQVVDWYHATEHLAHAAHLLHPDNPAVRTVWYEQQKDVLFDGHAPQLVQHLLSAAANKPASLAESLYTQAGYFHHNQERMAYAALQAAGYPIGSGTVESGCKQFKARFDGPGMRWSRPGAERLLPVRAAVMSDCFDATWSLAYRSPQN